MASSWIHADIAWVQRLPRAGITKHIPISALWGWTSHSCPNPASIRGAHTAHEAPGNPSPITNNPITTRSFSSGRVCFQPAADEPRGKLFAFTFSLLQDFPLGSAAQLCSTGCCSGCTGTQHIFFLAVQETLQICGIVGLKPAARLVCTDLAMPHERCGWRQPLAQQTHSQRLGI